MDLLNLTTELQKKNNALISKNWYQKNYIFKEHKELQKLKNAII